MKGRKDRFDNFKFSEYNESNIFHQDNLIGARYSTQVWMDENQEIFNFYGGYAKIKFNNPNLLVPSKELWKYNITGNMYAFMTKKDVYTSNKVHNLYPYIHNNKFGSFHAKNTPGGRYNHRIQKISENEILLIAGIGYKNYSYHEFYNLYSSTPTNDWWIYSTEINEWKMMGGDIWETNKTLFDHFKSRERFGELNIYHKNNILGARENFEIIKINEEEIFLYGDANLDWIQKYNITSNQWKLVRCRNSVNSELPTFGREYNDANNPERRKEFKMWKINEFEILLFGGFRDDSKYEEGAFLSDTFLYNIETDQWKFIGKEKSMYPNRYSEQNPNSDPSIFSEQTFVGGIREFSGHFIEEKNEIIIFGGYGYGLYGLGRISDFYRFFLGEMCMY